MREKHRFATTMPRSRSPSPSMQLISGPMGLMTRPWFVLAIVVTCFGILTPRIFIPIFRQMMNMIMGTEDRSQHEQINRMPPGMRMPSRGGPGVDYPSSGRPHPQQHAVRTDQGNQSGSGSRSLLNFLLPVYAIGIGMYMFYTLYKVFNSKKKREEEKLDPTGVLEDSDYEDSVKRMKRVSFKEKRYGSGDLVWDEKNSEFKVRQTYHQTGKKSNSGKQFRSEESEDEENDYIRYKDLDPEYVEHVKERRRKAKRARAQPDGAINDGSTPSLEKEVIVTPGMGLTSITNTNILMNDTLERMKFQLNKINMQLLHAEKKGNRLEDPDLEALRIQLAQTELQMSKIMGIVGKFSDTLEMANSNMTGYEYDERLSYYQEDDLQEVDSEEENDAKQQDYVYEEDIEDLGGQEAEENEENFEEVKIRYRGVKDAQKSGSVDLKTDSSGSESNEDFKVASKSGKKAEKPKPVVKQPSESSEAKSKKKKRKNKKNK